MGQFQIRAKICVSKRRTKILIKLKDRAILCVKSGEFMVFPTIRLITALSYIHPMTKVDAELLLPLLNNINYLSQTEQDLDTNVEVLHTCFREAKSTPIDLVKLLNDALPIAIENEIDFVLFMDTILAYLSRGYAQASIVERLSRQFTKKTI
jgi:hypothetical protein